MSRLAGPAALRRRLLSSAARLAAPHCTSSHAALWPVALCPAGAGQNLLDDGAAGGKSGIDASGNPILKDIGLYLRDYFKRQIRVSPPPPLHAVRGTPILKVVGLPSRLLHAPDQGGPARSRPDG
jgi:hypothetical protein